MQTTKVIDFQYFQLSQMMLKIYAFCVSEGCIFLKVSERFFETLFCYPGRTDCINELVSSIRYNHHTR